MTIFNSLSLRRSLSAVLLSATAIGAAQAESYDAPEAAIDALASALGAGEPSQIVAVLGEGSEDLIPEDPQLFALERLGMAELFAEGYRFAPRDEGGVELLLGAEGWPFPIPLMEGDGGWQFDLEAGREEILDREIGLNELETIALMDLYVDLQAQFRLSDPNEDGVMEFASAIISSAETRDGLFWPGDGSLVGEALARASAYGFSDGAAEHPPEPHFGYLFRVLQGQGEDAPGGRLDYMVNGHMLAGHALLAVPAIYGETGIHSFMVAENGLILEADLGEDTVEITAGLERYDPSEAWQPVGDLPPLQ
ncbi:MAG: DUF2950 domain-containing protein [Mangrovicoccus sp.]|nr:DUF2950 domain-containing protein [Mangrovicoccus sp.]